MEENNLVEEVKVSNNVRQLTFGISLTEDMISPTVQQNCIERLRQPLGNHGIVGSIILLPNAARIWMGWGTVSSNDDNNANLVGNGVPPQMGPMVVAFPRIYDRGEVSCTSLVGGESEEDLALASSMAARLTTKTGIPIYVSCILQSWQQGQLEWLAGFDRTQLTQMAAAVAERKIANLIKDARL
mmetsp:Transcript_18250/g.21068  ORF Transcript_18250/g.21068 Transcript_18250/m.21068 type:complete len:185 (+) Transcript_18250:47-601(+)|eukprot:CAMPEP_0194147180 /NCGR_PEP_ID=MMETSP0152-20130528/22574_1 /TAXON_ID=1049557 /ORGANISM="Thalassiothrix antarctica, Strain L6-D1" /LENGTH=184 /DNA_ID=CAMNT_0038847889 /DNA_START=42 /DNA_END=596 /DNA_ORIENTATION=-